VSASARPASLPAPAARRILDSLALAVEALAVTALAVNILVTFGNALVRYLTQQDFPWAADLWRVLIAMIAFLGAPAYFRRTNGMSYTAVLDMLEGSRRQALEACGLLIMLGVCITALVPFPQFFASQRLQTLPILGIDSGYVAVWLGVGLVLMCVFTLEKLATLAPKAIAIGALAPTTHGYTPLHIQLASAAFIGISAGTLLHLVAARAAPSLLLFQLVALATLVFLCYGPVEFKNDRLFTCLAFWEWVLCLDCAAALWALAVAVEMPTPAERRNEVRVRSRDW